VFEEEEGVKAKGSSAFTWPALALDTAAVLLLCVVEAVKSIASQPVLPTVDEGEKSRD
jgi:hypothetical protein